MNKRDLIKRRKELDARQAKPSESASIQRAFGTIKDGKAVIATETPVVIYDEVRRQWIQQVLLMDGVQFRNERRQLPIVDSHNDKTVRNVFGSIRGIAIEGDQLVGLPEFASDEESQKIATRYNEGHLNDFSIDAQVLARQYVPEGQQYTTRQGKVIEGPAEIVTQWEPHNASICATGADPNSTVRRSYEDREGVTRMDESLLATLKGLGLPDGMTDPTQIIVYLAGKAAAQSQDDAADASSMGTVGSMAGMDKPVDEAKQADTPADAPVDPAEEVKAEVARQLKAHDDRRKTIVAHCTLAKLERSFADALVDDPSVTVEIAQERIIRKMASQPLQGAVGGSDIRFGESEHDKFIAAAGAGLIQRWLRGKPSFQPSNVPGADEFANLGLYRLAEHCVRRMGINPDRLHKGDVARVAMGSRAAMGRLNIQRSIDNYHTTGSFAALLLDAANKTLRTGYEEAPYTWNLFARQATSVDDFKQINRTILGESPNFEMVPEGKPYPEKTIGDQKRSYKIEKWGEKFTVTWETVVNDDLDALARIPAMHGAAARRTQEKNVYDAFLSNPVMVDGKNLFASDHASGSNITGTTPAAPSTTTLDEAFKLMGLQKGLSSEKGVSDVYLGLVPRVLLVPLNYSANALVLVGSTSYAVANGNSGVVNIYGTNGSRPLTVVTSPLLDANNATNWYAFGDNSQVDTVEITFLAGEESPVLENEWDMESDTYLYKARQSFMSAAIDHRGIFGNR